MSTAVVSRPTTHHADERALIAAVRAGDDRAFECLYRRYHQQIYVYVRGMVRDYGRAEDITQDVFFSALRCMRADQRDIAFKPWIYGIAKNACIDAWRRSRRTDEVSFDTHDVTGAAEQHRLADPHMTPDVAMDTKQQLADLRGALVNLSPAQHDVLVMRELEGRSYREIGERLGMSRAAVESTLFRARQRLAEEYEELVSGRHCVRVRGIIAAGGVSVGARDHRRMARHISHCQSCRRHAVLAGVDLSAPAARSVPARIAGVLPLPAFLKRRWADDGGLLSAQASSPVTQWSAHIAATLDPATAASWPKAMIGAAAVVIGGLGAGTAIEHRDPLRDLLERAPIVRDLRADAAALLGSRTAGPRDAQADAAPAVMSPPVEVPASRSPAAERRVPSPGGGGTTSARSGGEASGETPGAAAPSTPSSQASPALGDVVSALPPTTPATTDSTGGAVGHAGHEPAHTDTAAGDGPNRNLLEGALGGSGPGGEDSETVADTQTATGTAGAAGETATSASAGSGVATPDIVGQAVGGLGATTSAIQLGA